MTKIFYNLLLSFDNMDNLKSYIVCVSENFTNKQEVAS